MFKNFEDTHEEYLDNLLFDEYFDHDQLTLPELANFLEIPTEHHFRWWYGDPTWKPTSETSWVSLHTPTWARDSSSLQSSRPYSIEEPNSHPQVLSAPELLRAIQKQTRPQVRYPPGFIQQINHLTSSIVPSPDSITTQIYLPKHVLTQKTPLYPIR